MKKMMLAGSAAAALFAATAVGAGAAPFLCPVIGEGALGAPGLEGKVGPLGDGATFLPGNNQAGDHANPNAYNEFGAPSDTNVPGTPGFTPIWNP
jgi:hypothetical protein